jgi:hypothetical protein
MVPPDRVVVRFTVADNGSETGLHRSNVTSASRLPVLWSYNNAMLPARTQSVPTLMVYVPGLITTSCAKSESSTTKSVVTGSATVFVALMVATE